MGTNFYVECDPCPHCGRSAVRRHIGKSSGGWCFSLHVDEQIPSLDEWKREWSKSGVRIVDEYGEERSPASMLAIITERSWNPRGTFDYQRNHAEPGPNGLARHKLGYGCIGHGDGTYDLIVGDFS